MKKILQLMLPLLLPAFLGTGCATKALWKQRDFFEPAPNPRLEVFHSTPRQDFLIQYDELKRNDQTLRRAYWLYANTQRSLADKKPAFVPPGQTNGLLAVQVLHEGNTTTNQPSAGLYAVNNTNQNEFTLYSDGRQVSSHSLPVYRDEAQRTRQVLLTPAAVVADVIIVVVPVGFILWAESGFWPLPEL